MGPISLPHINKSVSTAHKHPANLITGGLSSPTNKEYTSNNLSLISPKSKTKVIGNRNYSMVVEHLTTGLPFQQSR